MTLNCFKHFIVLSIIMYICMCTNKSYIQYNKHNKRRKNARKVTVTSDIQRHTEKNRKQ